MSIKHASSFIRVRIAIALAWAMMAFDPAAFTAPTPIPSEPEQYDTDACRDMPTFRLQREGELFAGVHEMNVGSGRLRGVMVDCVVLVGESRVMIYEFRAGSLSRIFDTEFSYERIDKSIPRVPPFAIGDFNGNGLEEIALCLGDRIVTYEWDGKGFADSEYEFPYSIIECTSGKALDGMKDWIVASAVDEVPKDDEDRPVIFDLRLNVFRLEGGGVQMIYDGMEDVELKMPRVIPPDHLVCVADYDNSGAQRLIVSDLQSDVSPTRYRSYRWNESEKRFSLEDRFVIANGKLNRDALRERDCRNFAVGPIWPIVLSGRTFLLFDYFGAETKYHYYDTDNPAVQRVPSKSNYGDGRGNCVMCRIDDQGMHCCVFENRDTSSSGRLVFVQDADGSDRGLLAITAEYFGQPWPDGTLKGWFRYFTLSDPNSKRGVFEVDSLKTRIVYEYDKKYDEYGWYQYIDFKYRFLNQGGLISDYALSWAEISELRLEMHSESWYQDSDTTNVWMEKNERFPLELVELSELNKLDSVQCYIRISGDFYDRLPETGRVPIGRFNHPDTLMAEIVRDN
mgnify:CR=1 FL=1